MVRSGLPLEGDEFEPQVPRQEDLCNTEIAADREPGGADRWEQQQILATPTAEKPPSGNLPLRRREGHCSSLPAITPR